MPIIPSDLRIEPGTQNSGGITLPKDTFVDFVRQGFLSPTSLNLTSTMSTAAWPGSAAAVAVAFAGGHRVYKFVGASDLTHTYTANRDTYDDIDLNGVIYHRSVSNGAAVPSFDPFTELRLQKVVTNALFITSVTQLASTIPIASVVAPFVSAPQAIVNGGTITLPQMLGLVPTEYRYKLVCQVPDAGYLIGDELFDICLTGRNASAIATSILSDATNLYIAYLNSPPSVFQALNRVTGAGQNLVNSSWLAVFQARRS